MDKKKQNTILVLYGAMGVGKLTVGNILAKKLNFKLTHNHLINDLVSSIFEKTEAHDLIETMRYDFYKKAAKSGKNIIITHCYSHNFVSPTGLSDPEYLKGLEKILSKNGTKVSFIHLQANHSELLKRVSSPSRKKYQKLTDTSVMKKFLKTEDFTTSAPVKNNIVIDTTNKKASDVAKEIIKKINS